VSRQFRRLQRIRLKTTAQRAVPADFMARMLAAHHAHRWAGRARQRLDDRILGFVTLAGFYLLLLSSRREPGYAIPMP
jgi:hypothetical protein